MNYSSTDIRIFSETRFSHADNNCIYKIGHYSLFRNDSMSSTNDRPSGGTAVYGRIDYYRGMG